MSTFVKNIFDTDLYKFTTSYAYMKLYPNAMGRFKFCDRNNTAYTKEQYMLLQRAINDLADLESPAIPYTWLQENIPFIPLYYWEWLQNFRFEPHKIELSYDDKTGHIDIEVFDHIWKVTLYEIAILCIMAGIQNYHLSYDEDTMLNRLKAKIKMAEDNDLYFSEFGTRRRFSYEVQDEVVKYLSQTKNCTGTSNVWLAYKYNMKPMGTHPHEWFMFHGAQFGYQHANYLALEAWMKVYNGDLGIALTDTYTSDVFFKNFSMLHAKTFEGTRQDSGDEFEFTDKAIARYNELNINPKFKTIVFSNGLDFPYAVKINEYCKDKIIARFGIGTNLTNDTGLKAPNIVMKLISCRMTENSEDRDCIKLSDDYGKHMGNPDEIRRAIEILNIKS